MEIILVKCSLSIIEPVSIPPCNVLQSFGNLLALNEKESKEKFCDVKFAATEMIMNIQRRSASTPTKVYSLQDHQCLQECSHMI